MSDGTSVARPAPLVGEGVSMSGNDWFPLYFDRLRKSKWWRRATDTARARNIMLWGEAYKQIPAGSMPDDDDELAEAAGFGMDVDAFLAVKAEIMAPWVLCLDGRWYHPTVCEMVLEAWDRASDRRKRDAEKKRIARERVRENRDVPRQNVDVPGDIGNVPSENQDVPGDMPDFDGDIGTQTRQTRQYTPQPPSGGVSDDEFDAIWSAYPESGRETCPALQARDEIDAAVAEGHEVAVLVAGAKRVAAHVAAGGRPKRIDRWAKDRLFLNTAPPKGPTVCGEAWTGPPDLFADAAAAKGAAWADAYLRRCAWRDGALVTDSKTVRRVVQAEIEQILAAHGARIELEGVGA